jgi:hypothetical protein
MRNDGKQEVVFAGGFNAKRTPLDIVEIYSVDDALWRTGTTCARWLRTMIDNILMLDRLSIYLGSFQKSSISKNNLCNCYLGN